MKKKGARYRSGRYRESPRTRWAPSYTCVHTPASLSALRRHVEGACGYNGGLRTWGRGPREECVCVCVTCDVCVCVCVCGPGCRRRVRHRRYRTGQADSTYKRSVPGSA
eukprot:2624554-Rhodomonas_salina.1